MSSTGNPFWRALQRALAPPVLAERAMTMQAQLLHGVVLATALIGLVSLFIGVPFVFGQKVLAACVALAVLGAAVLSWILCRRGKIQTGARILILMLWLVAVGLSLFSHRTEVTLFVPTLFIALLLSGPVLALAVAGSGIALFAGMQIALQLGLSWPRPFPAPPQSVLFMAMIFLALAAVPVAMLARQFRTAVEDFNQFRMAQRDLSIVTWIWDIAADQVWLDGDQAPLLGLAPGTYSGRFEDYLKCVHPDDRQLAKQRLADCLKGRAQFYSGEDRVIWPDGSVHWLSVRGQASYGADGRASRMTGVVGDITERKLSERALAQTRERLAIAFSASPDAIIISAVSDGRILDANPALARITGFSLDSVRNRTGVDVGLWANPADRDKWFKMLREQGDIHDRMFDFRTSDGSLRCGRLSSSLVQVDDEECIVSIVRDVTEQVMAERKLQESEAKYAAFFDTCPDATLITRKSDGAYLDFNRAWSEMSGYTREEALGRSAFQLNQWINPADRQAALAEIAAHGKLMNFPTQFRHKNGAVRDALLSAAEIQVKGEPCIAWTRSDITELLRLERESAQANQRYRALFDAALDAIAIVSPEGALLDINAFGLRATGYSREACIGKSVAMLFDPRDLEKEPLRLADVFDKGEMRIKHRVLTKDGHEIPVELVASPLPDGNIMAIVRDVSERKRNQALLQNIARGVSSEVGDDFFRSLVGNLSKELAADYCFIGEILRDDPGKVRTLSYCANGLEAPNFVYSLEGSPCSLALSKRGSIAIPGDVCQKFPEDLGLQRMGVQGYVGTSLLDAAGKGVGILVVMSRNMIVEVGLWTSVLEIFGTRAAAEIERAHADARLRKLNLSLEQRVRERTAELELANQELESFSYSISHDLRAPLRAINGYAKVLSVEYEAKLDEDARSLLSRIGGNAVRMNRLIEDVLEFSRLGRGTLQAKRIDMRALVDEVAAESQASAGARAQISIGELPPATGDIVVVRQVWQNLIGNALKFSRHAANPRIEIEAAKRDGMVEYLVRDNGAGFDAEYADRLFGVFQRLHSSKEYEGTGIGLAIARRIVQRHGGSISAEGALGSGATFRFTLPC